ncbi:uncharacterized protein LOC114294649 [Camellia sinensis]|uniref:uncharacterized protein LOC114294649 n=1 Tax=Camellia sinensis TaxID=4442 RepID=UPI001036A613|nr:uncharacterized protein LOC114294649 [Camellia sinensis]
MVLTLLLKTELYLKLKKPEVFEEPDIVKLKVLNHFKRQFTESWEGRLTLGDTFKSIEAIDAFCELEADFSVCELLKHEVMHFIRDFHSSCKLSYGINSSFITLIPKTDNPFGLADFRPISLVGCMYKILSKVFAHRLKRVLPEVIGDPQSAFLGGRSILDGVFIANEIVDGWKKSKKKGLVIKLDFEKAYDLINWKFLFSMLANFGFGSEWISWMRVLAEGLNILINRTYEKGFIKGIKVGVNEVMISHLQFADDSLLFCETDLDQLVHIKRVLRCFEILSGMKINFHKSVVYGVGMDDDTLTSCADILNCKIQGLPLKFLSLPLGANPGRKSTGKPVLDKVRARLAGWKAG